MKKGFQHYRKKYDKYMNFSTGWNACKVFLPPLGAIILNFSTMHRGSMGVG